MMSPTAPSAAAFRVAKLSQTGENPFNLRPDADQCAAISAELGLSDLRKLRFEGHIKAQGDQDWILRARLGATVVQPCTVTLEPVTTRVEAPTERVFMRQIEPFDDTEEEIEMPEDERIEPLGQWIDVEAVMIEALSLAVPEYPRKDGANLGEAIYAEPGTTPMTDEAARPFAGLEALKGKLGLEDNE